MKNKFLWTMSAAAMLAAPLGTARADIFFYTTFGAFQSALNAAGGSVENVLTQGALTGLTVQGITNQSNSLVNVSSSISLSTQAANGQAVFTAATLPNIGQAGLNIFLPNNQTFTALAFNLDNVQGSNGNETITVTEPAGSPTPGNTPFVTSIGNGSNFIGILAINNQRISNVAVSGTVNLQDLAQVRIGGIGTVSAVPEPSTYALMATGLVGLVGFARRRRQQV